MQSSTFNPEGPTTGALVLSGLWVVAAAAVTIAAATRPDWFGWLGHIKL